MKAPAAAQAEEIPCAPASRKSDILCLFSQCPLSRSAANLHDAMLQRKRKHQEWILLKAIILAGVESWLCHWTRWPRFRRRLTTARFVVLQLARPDCHND